MNPDSIFERLRRDHARVLADLVALERAAQGPGEGAGDGERLQLLRGHVGMLEAQFATHMAAEDEVLYPALRQALPEMEGRLAPLGREHRELRSMLVLLAALLERPATRERDEQIAVQAQDLVDLLRIHIRKEEVVVFGVAGRVLGPREMQQLADRMTPDAGGTPTAPAAGA